MFNKLTVLYVFLLLLNMQFTSCAEEIVREVEVPIVIESAFEELPQSIDPYRRIFQIHRFADQLLLQGEDVHFFFEGSNDSEVASVYNNQRSVRSKESFSEELYVGFTNSFFEAQPINPTLRLDNAPRVLVYLDSVLAADYILPVSTINYRDDLAILSDDNHLLLPYTVEGDPRLRIGIGALQFPNPWFSGSIELLSWNNVVIEETEETVYHAGGKPMQEIEGGFLVYNPGSHNQSTYRVTYDGSYTPVFSGDITGFFKYQGSLYAYGDASGSSEFNIYSLSPDGLSWSLIYTIANTDNQRFRFFPTEEALFLVNTTSASGQIFITTEMSTTDLSFAALDTEELEDYVVTDIAYFDNYVYISTLSGFFRRDWQEFIDSRQE